MPRFKSIIFYYNSSKIKLFLKKIAIFQALEAPPPDPRGSDGWGPPASGGWGQSPQTPNAAPPPPLRISGYAPGHY